MLDDDENEEDYDDDPFEQVFDEAEDLRKNTMTSGKRPISRKYITPSTGNKIDSSKIDKKYIADKNQFDEAQKQRTSGENILIKETKSKRNSEDGAIKIIKEVKVEQVEKPKPSQPTEKSKSTKEKPQKIEKPSKVEKFEKTEKPIKAEKTVKPPPVKKEVKSVPSKAKSIKKSPEVKSKDRIKEDKPTPKPSVPIPSHIIKSKL